MRPSVQIASVLALGVIGVGAAISLAETSGGSTPVRPAPHTQTSEGSPQVESKDLLSLRLDDRSSSGIVDIWLQWTVKNHSSKKSDYTFDWEAVDAKTGKRVDSGTEYESNVLPGQTLTGDTFTELDSGQPIKLNITHFDRTRAY